MWQKEQTKVEENSWDVGKLAVPVLLAASILPLVGCGSDRSPLPQAPDRISATFGSSTRLQAQSLQHQRLLDSCIDVRSACDKLMRGDKSEAAKTYEMINNASAHILIAKNHGSTFPDQVLLNESYQALQSVGRILQQDEHISVVHQGSYNIADRNFYQVEALAAQMDLVIGTIASPSAR